MTSKRTDKLRRVTSPELNQLTGYLAAAQHAIMKGQYDLSLYASVFEIEDAIVSDEDILTLAYEGFNPIEDRAECSLDTMIARINEVLTLPRHIFATDWSGIPAIVEARLREGYWPNVRACFDCANA